MNKYRLLGKKGEGTFSEVLKAQSTKNGKYVAIKCMKNRFESIEQVNRLREIQALRRLSPHPNIVKLYEVLYDRPTGRLALVFELMDMNIYELIRGRRHYLPEDKIRLYMYQLLKAMDHMHRNGIFHRDIKPENILITEDQLKLADFGSCRGIYSKQPFTEYISTRWYRAPECLLTDGYYNYKMDMWGVGCVFFEIMSLYPLFPGTNELDQIHKIHAICGTPPADLLEKFKRCSSHIDFNFPPKEGTGIDKLLPHASAACVDLIKNLLAYNPDERFSARQALKHEYFRDLRDTEKRMKKKLASDAGSEHGLSSPRTPRSQLGNDDASSIAGMSVTEKGGSDMLGIDRNNDFVMLPSITKGVHPQAGSGVPVASGLSGHHVQLQPHQPSHPHHQHATGHIGHQSMHQMQQQSQQHQHMGHSNVGMGGTGQTGGAGATSSVNSGMMMGSLSGKGGNGSTSQKQVNLPAVQMMSKEEEKRRKVVPGGSSKATGAQSGLLSGSNGGAGKLGASSMSGASVGSGMSSMSGMSGVSGKAVRRV